MKRALALAAAAAAIGVARARRESAAEADLAGRVVLITGGSRGLGFALAEQLAAAGCRVAICGRDEAALAIAEAKLRLVARDTFAMPCDVRHQTQVQAFVRAAVERFGRVDVLVNNAGVISVGPYSAMTRDDYAFALDTMFWGPYHATMAVLPDMIARGDGQIVNVSSIGGKVAVPHLLPYDTAKFALAGFSEGLAAELARSGVQVTTVVPGLMRTGSHVNALFKGHHKLEYTWFSVLGNLPITSVDAPAAAARIVRAIARREAEVFITPHAHLAARLHGLMPGLAVRVLGLVDRGLPPGVDAPTSAHPGHASETAVTRSPLLALGRRAVARFQQGIEV